ncbi:uncharacterized protein BDR25DRAFT_299514 [Lindgomyces ingoldianus]|uniref:Uncharacterized protein n=1 Tax=Lindgomyces ingoldianus TaxID=673940 RepID=A0ACB6RH50_9PLEO|nr:uncharacterized protein BDR25DRAFT_299514 [Lindgomyces ingoldianus]KAF2477652.1 hypothetical protein BDR25DRAFT_299514 [Lindgomyces ingoldianus]
MGDSVQGTFKSIQEEFKARLKREWTRPVACQRQCDPPETCTCHRRFVHVDKLEAWMNRQDSQDSPNTKAGRLLAELHDKIKHHAAFGFPLDYRPLFTGEDRCTRVFSMLLEKDRGELIDLFHGASMYDRYLNLPEHNYNADHPILRDKLREKHIPEADINNIVTDFEKEKWAYCPPLSYFRLYMEGDLAGGKMIMPFCHRIRVNNKGGTASVSWVAIQEDLIVDEDLRGALSKSLYKDPEFGWCFQMILKSYSEENKDIYSWEKEAFSGLKNDPEMPIVRYLGCYTHDNREKGTKGKTYNLLLEYGERDLDEYFADLTNVAPVRSPEIIRFWESLFKVAIAIERIHNLKIIRGKQIMEYHGWHADIKPDNILRVHGEFKLADFGFSRFSEKKGRGEVPTQYIEGGTDTYGAPEFARMKISGTRSEVTQSIDTWSFGCVLSVAATWVVLGLQGTRQYRKLREMTRGTQTPDGRITDRFHDCNDVLPEIKRWHNFLRGHIRSADTATPLVLDLIELHMLQRDTRDRYEFSVLCGELKKLIKTAKRNIEDLPQYTRETDDSVKRALLAIENEAQQSRASGMQTTPLQRHSQASKERDQLVERTWRVPVDPSQRATMRFQKETVLESIPLAETPYRKELLEQELEGAILEETSGSSNEGRHGGATTYSPIEANLSEYPPPPSPRPLTPRNPNLKMSKPNEQPPESTHSRSVAQPNSVPVLNQPQPRTTSPKPIKSILSTSNGSAEKPQALSRRQSRRVIFGEDLDSNTDSSRSNQRRQSHSLNYGPGFTTSIGFSPPVEINPTTKLRSEDLLDPLPVTPPAHANASSQNPIVPLNGTSKILRGSETDYTLQNGLNDDLHPPLTHGFHPSAADKAGTKTLVFAVGEPEQPVPDTGVDSHATANLSPSIVVTPSAFASNLPTSELPMSYPPLQLTGKEEQFISNTEPPQPLNSLDGSQKTVLLPDSVYGLPWDVCHVRKTLDNNKPKTKKAKAGAMLKGLLGMEELKKDENLATFIHNRDLVFVVDNGSTMVDHWPIVTFVAETLAKKIAGLDENGFDVKFTINGHSLNKSELRGEDGRRKFKDVLNTARPKEPLSNDFFMPTDMNHLLHDVFRQWWDPSRSNQKATTLLVLTDGIWKGTNPPDAINKTIVKFAKQLEENDRFGPRHFTIGFIRFGVAGKERLKILDDRLCKENHLEDIIDESSWKAQVHKMLTGSVDSFQDECGKDSEDIDPYDYAQLNMLFEAFNNSNNNLSVQVPRPAISRSSSGTSSIEFQRQGTDTGGRSIASAPFKEKSRNRLSKMFSPTKSSWDD